MVLTMCHPTSSSALRHLDLRTINDKSQYKYTTGRVLWQERAEATCRERSHDTGYQNEEQISRKPR
jgi:hypothetical protein